MYESPSPPSSDTANEDVYVASRRQRDADVNSTMVSLAGPSERPISPIHRDAEVWTSNYASDNPDEGTRLVSPGPPSHPDDAGNEPIRTDSFLSRTRFAQNPTFLPPRGDSFRGRDPSRNTAKDRYVLGCSIVLVATIVFIIIVSGITTMVENSNFPKLEVFSDWPDGGVIPLKYGCDSREGDPISFPLQWNNVPRPATNLVILFSNAGAMLRKGYDPVHWLVSGIPVNEGNEFSLPANSSANSTLMPFGAKQLPNSFSESGTYYPPCSFNRSGLFVVHVYAIEAPAVISDFRDAREVMNRFVGVPVAKLTGRYGASTSPDEQPSDDTETANSDSVTEPVAAFRTSLTPVQ